MSEPRTPGTGSVATSIAESSAVPAECVSPMVADVRSEPFSDRDVKGRVFPAGTLAIVAGIVLLGPGVGKLWRFQKTLPRLPSVVVSEDTAHIAFEPIVLLTHDQSPQHVGLTLRNPWSEPIDIESIQTSCSCSEPKVRDHHISPGMSTELDLRFQPSYSGVRRPVELTILAKPNKVMLCSLSIQTLRYIHVETALPETLAFGDVRVSDDIERSWPMYVLEKKDTTPPIRVIGIGSDDDRVCFDALPVLAPTGKMPLQTSPRLTVRSFILRGHLRSNRQPGPHRSSLRVVYQSDGRQHERRLSVTWNVLAALQVEPRQIVWNVNALNRSGSLVAARAVLSAKDGIPFRIESYKSEYPWLIAEYKRAETSRSHEIVFRLQDLESAVHDGFQDIVFMTDHPRQPNVRLSVTVIGDLTGGGP